MRPSEQKGGSRSSLLALRQQPLKTSQLTPASTSAADCGNGEYAAYRSLGVEEADPEQGSISWIAPLARSLLSRRAGDKVSFRSPGGDEELTIMTVRYSGGSAPGGRALTSEPSESIPFGAPGGSPVRFQGLPRIAPRLSQVLFGAVSAGCAFFFWWRSLSCSTTSRAFRSMPADGLSRGSRFAPTNFTLLGRAGANVLAVPALRDPPLATLRRRSEPSAVA